LLNAGPKKGYSFTWQSIISGLQTFRRGHILRVGNGRRINIWKDHWITGSLSQKIDTPFGQSLLSTVDELIDPATGQWDKIILTFNPLEVQHILQIPISSNLEEDFVAWHKTKSFSFSVRPAYYTEWTHQFGGRVRHQDGQGTANHYPVWDIVWKLQVPAKIKKNIWPSLHDLVPGMGILRIDTSRYHHNAQFESKQSKVLEI
jgi:hypothetical protein